MESKSSSSSNITRTGTIISPGRNFSAFGDNTPDNSPGPYSQLMKERGGLLTVVDRKTKDEINRINRKTHGARTVVNLMKDFQGAKPRRSTRIPIRVNPYGGKKSRKNRRKTKKRRKSKRRRRKGKKSVKSRRK